MSSLPIRTPDGDDLLTPRASGSPVSDGDARRRGVRLGDLRASVMTTTPGTWPALVGRRHEREVFDRLLEENRRGRGSALVVCGEPGVGKTALLEYVAESAHHTTVLRAAGHEGEFELPYSALQQLCAPARNRIDNLPSPRASALKVIFGESAGEPPTRLLIGLAVLTLLSQLAAEQPVLCLIDDAQWLDQASAQAILFAARRLETEAVSVVLASRTMPDEVHALPELVVGGLSDADARALFDAVFPYRLDEAVLDRIVAETHGNPLALLELPRGLTPAQIAGGFGLPVSLPLTGRIEESFRRRVMSLPGASRRLLLLAAADPTGDAALVWRAAVSLGIPAYAADWVEATGLIDLRRGAIFRHPLARSAVYRTSSAQDRREVHLALAQAVDPVGDPDRRVWHLGQAVLPPDEDVAAQLEQSAWRVQARGGFAAAAAFMERATELTGDPVRRAGRALIAAEAKRQAGALESALGFASIAEAGPLAEPQSAQLELLRAQICFAADRGSDAPSALLKAAQRLEAIDVGRARETYLDALTAALFAGKFARNGDGCEVARSAYEAARPTGPPRGSDLLLDGLSLLIIEGFGSGTPVLREALMAFRDPLLSTQERVRWSWLAGRAAAYIWDYESWDDLTSVQIDVAQREGALAVLPLTLSTRGGVEVFAGRLNVAASLVDQVAALADTTGHRTVPYAALAVAAFRGEVSSARQLISDCMKDFDARGEGMGVNLAQWCTAVLCNGLAHYQESFDVGREALQGATELWFSPWIWVEMVEASSRLGLETEARQALERLSEGTRASGSDWALAVEARCRGLVCQGSTAEESYRVAIDLLSGSKLGMDLARSYLVFGEWLRRERRPREAREQLRQAYEMFSEFGMLAFAERAQMELRATGERTRKRESGKYRDLTPQESRISLLVAEGASNPEIAAQLFISPSTVEYHLRKVFNKLGLRSRTQLARYVLDKDRGLAEVRN